MHVDDFIDSNYGKHKYARWWFSLFRLPAVLRVDFAQWIQPYKLYCSRGGERFRVTGCSSMGDVWIHSDLTNEHVSDGGTRQEFYTHRVNVAECSDWSPAP